MRSGILGLLGLCLPSVLLGGCYLSHGRDSRDGGATDARIDAPVGRDAPIGRDAPRPVGSYWTLEERTSRLSIPHQLGCTQYEGGRITLEIFTGIRTICEHDGPFDIRREGRDYVVTSYVWVEHREDPSSCLGVTDQARRSVLLQAEEGTFLARTSDGSSSVTYDVGVIDGRRCSPPGARDAECLMDCDCESGLVCIPHAGDFVECFGGTCGNPCNPLGSAEPAVYGRHLECGFLEECGPGPGASPQCRPVTVGCNETSCRPGLYCPMPSSASAECNWVLELDGDNRHPCTSEADCDPGLHCVEHRDGARSCEVPCFTIGMRCPVMHACTAERWVCEWLGE